MKKKQFFAAVLALLALLTCLFTPIFADEISAENVYVSVRDRVNFASGISIASNVSLVKGHTYSIDIDIFMVNDGDVVRVMAADENGGKVASNSNYDIGNKRGYELKHGANTLTGLQFVSIIDGKFRINIHSEKSSDPAYMPGDFCIDNVVLRDVTENKVVFKYTFDSEKETAMCTGLTENQASQSVKVESGEYVLGKPKVSNVENSLNLVYDDYYLTVTNRANYASGVSITSDIELIKGHEYRLDFNLCMVNNDEKLRILAENSKMENMTTFAVADFNSIRGFNMKKGWNEVKNLKFVANSDGKCVIKIHSEKMGNGIIDNGDFYIDNVHFYDITADKQLFVYTFDDPEQFDMCQGNTGYSASQVIGSSKIELPKYDPASENYEVQGVIINQDPDFIGSCVGGVTEQELRDYALSYRDSHVTDYMICLFSKQAMYPSEVATDYVDNYYYCVENNITPSNNYKAAYELFVEQGIDYIDIWCETFPTVGINPWISLRMNDSHNLSDPDYEFTPKFYRDNPQLRRVHHPTEVNTYYNNCLDYTYDATREHLLAIINEALGRYNCYGVELDFQRDIWLWHTGGEYEGLDILTDFMRELDRVVKTYEVKYGHDIKVAVRCASDIQTNYDFGLDVITWAAEGLVDLVNPTARWRTTDFEVPVRTWVAVMHPYGVEVAPGVEKQIYTGSGSVTGYHSLETLAGASANWLSQGADKIYLYNHFLNMNGMITESDRTTINLDFTNVLYAKGLWNAITTIGSYEKVMLFNRRTLLTYNDMWQIWKDDQRILALSISPNKSGCIRMTLGDVPEGADVTFKIAVNSANVKNPPTVYINSYKAEFIGFEECHDGYTTSQIACYSVPQGAHDDMYIVAEITVQKYLFIDYAEIYVDVKN